MTKKWKSKLLVQCWANRWGTGFYVIVKSSQKYRCASYFLYGKWQVASIFTIIEKLSKFRSLSKCFNAFCLLAFFVIPIATVARSSVFGSCGSKFLRKLLAKNLFTLFFCVTIQICDQNHLTLFPHTLRHWALSIGKKNCAHETLAKSSFSQFPIHLHMRVVRSYFFYFFLFPFAFFMHLSFETPSSIFLCVSFFWSMLDIFLPFRIPMVTF